MTDRAPDRPGGVHLGSRVVVTGLAGAGKSTLATKLAELAGLPLVRLDLAYWQPGWVAPSEDEWRAIQRRLLGGPEWIVEGNYRETLDLRLESADTLVVLDVAWWLCSARAIRRGFVLPDQLPAGCEYSRWARFTDEWKLAWLIWKARHQEPQQERDTIARHGQGLRVHVLRSTREVDEFLRAVGAQRPG